MPNLSFGKAISKENEWLSIGENSG